MDHSETDRREDRRTAGHPDRHLEAVRRIVAERVGRVSRRVAGARGAEGIERLCGGKMLRSRLAGRILEHAGPAAGLEEPTAAAACAATELFHAASLCHDDVIDGAPLRRGGVALWAATSRSGAVLVGDLLLFEAIDLLRRAAGGRLLGAFLSKVQEVLGAETEQELVLRGRRLEEATCLRLCREKTGPLFAFVAGVCGGTDVGLSAALEEAGYRLGTAYQLADDLLDVVGLEAEAGKTLGTDAARGKYTLAGAGEDGRRWVRRRAGSFCAAALEAVGPYPPAREALRRYCLEDLRPVLAALADVEVELVS